MRGRVYGVAGADNGRLQPYLDEISKHRTLSNEEEAHLARRIRKGDECAVEHLVRANLRFVINVARNYQNQGLPLSDLINEGNIGMIRAARRFDERKNFRFITYAVWWVRQSILRALADSSRVVKLPLNRVGMLHRIWRTHGRLEQRLGRQPAADELAAELHMRPSDVGQTVGAARRLCHWMLRWVRTMGRVWVTALPMDARSPPRSAWWRIRCTRESYRAFASLTLASGRYW